MTPEQRLFAAILQQAVRDLFAEGIRSHDGRPDVAATDQAIRLLTDTSGSYAQWRRDLCLRIDQDGDKLAARIRMMLEGEIDFPPIDERMAKRRAAQVAFVRERWQYLKTLA